MMMEMGNSRARAVYEANLPDNYRRPQTDSYPCTNNLLSDLKYICHSVFRHTYTNSSKGLPYKFYVLGQIGLSKQCRPRSDCF